MIDRIYANSQNWMNKTDIVQIIRLIMLLTKKLYNIHPRKLKVFNLHICISIIVSKNI